ncbi:MAG: hypothetical protein QXS54_03905 [Candidatus Methanomethylicaceae archaeon]
MKPIYKLKDIILTEQYDESVIRDLCFDIEYTLKEAVPTEVFYGKIRFLLSEAKDNIISYDVFEFKRKLGKVILEKIK